MLEILDWLNTNHNAVTSIGANFGVLIFAFGVFQYWKAENWKRTEFVASLYKELIKDESCKRAMSMIDWPEAAASLFNAEDVPGSDGGLLRRALDMRNEQPDRLEIKIRDDFDRFFVFLEQFERAIRNRLVREKDVLPYFAYWIWSIREDDPSGRAIQKYVEDAEFDDVSAFLRRGPT